MYEGINEIILRCREKGIKTHIYSSGNVTDMAEKLVQTARSGLSRIIFSLFAANDILHDKITGIQGSHSNTVSAIKTSILNGIDTEIHFVPMSSNFREIEDLTMMASKMGIKKVSLLRYVPQGRGKDNCIRELTKEENIELRQILLNIKEVEIRLGSPYNCLCINKKSACFSGIDRLTITPDLRIYPCDAFKRIMPADIGTEDKMSSLENNSLEECWNHSPYLMKIREYLMAQFSSECDKCHLLEMCLSGCMAQKYHAYGGLIKKPDPMCLRSNI
jgi:radical SAM protein with 4Fe4S-binding SPASM domain